MRRTTRPAEMPAIRWGQKMNERIVMRASVWGETHRAAARDDGAVAGAEYNPWRRIRHATSVIGLPTGIRQPCRVLQHPAGPFLLVRLSLTFNSASLSPTFLVGQVFFGRDRVKFLSGAASVFAPRASSAGLPHPAGRQGGQPSKTSGGESMC